MAIKPIQTNYKGYFFRSRLEARWAVFFETLGVEWEYEPEGYDIGGLYYLPDFRVKYLDGGIHWFEVKSDLERMTDEEKMKVKLFSKYVDAITILDGTPDYITYPTFCNDTHWREGDFDKEFDEKFSESKNKSGRWGDLLTTIKRDGYPERMWVCEYSSDVSEFLKRSPYYSRAVTAARSARFEHGESPVVS